MYLVVATWSDDTRKMERFDTFGAAEARVREVLADPYLYAFSTRLDTLNIDDESGVILKKYVVQGKIWEEKVKRWKVEYEVNEDMMDGARDKQISYFNAPTPQEAVNQCRSQFKPRHQLDVKRVYLTDEYETFARRVHNWL